MKFVLLVVFIFPFICYSQELDLIISHLPVRNGVIYKPITRYGCLLTKNDGVFIYSKNDSCFSINRGVVSAVFDLGGEFAVLVKTVDEKYFAYAHLKIFFAVKGDTIERGDVIGLIHHNDSNNDLYELLFLMTKPFGKFYTYNEHLSFLKISNSDCVYSPSLCYRQYTGKQPIKLQTFLNDFSFSLPSTRKL